MESTVLVMSACDLRWPSRRRVRLDVQPVLAGGKECAYAKPLQIKLSNCVKAVAAQQGMLLMGVDTEIETKRRAACDLPP